MTDDHERLAALVGNRPQMRLRRALAALGGVLTLANTGAHPDDEQNGLLAALRFGLGMRTVVMCSTRGEGGQNALGPERGADLAALRTREMEEAARRISAELVWLGHGPEDAVRDFGFSKDGDDTLRRWGAGLLHERMVRAYRTLRPDIVLPTFLDVPGQHGHHRAMTRAAFAAIAGAADPLVHPEQGLAPWAVSKFYLPAWSGAGLSYDDEVPPPAATVVVTVPGGDPVTGAGWGQLGEWSRAAHASQGMGRWRERGEDRWPLHLAWSRAAGPEEDLRDGLPADLRALAVAVGSDAMAEAAVAVDRVVSAFPDGGAVRAAAVAAHRLVGRALEALSAAEAAQSGHRLRRKLVELEVVLRAVDGGAAEDTVRAVAMPSDVVSIVPEAVLLAAGAAGAFEVRTQGGFVLPDGWRAEPVAGGVRVHPPVSLAPGRIDLPAVVEGRPGFGVTAFAYPHVGEVVRVAPAVLRVLALDVVRPDGARVAYLGSGHDRVGVWLARLGIDVVAIGPGALDPEIDGAALGGFTTVVVGLQAFAGRADLVAAAPLLHRFVVEGGHLLTFMHRAQDGWEAAQFPNHPIAIGTPSVRWRVCAPDAPVDVLVADHPLLVGPNRIGPEDWAGWDKERGLYFAQAWDGAYVPLLAMSDPGEAPLQGALLSGRIGAGRHTHCALALPHQLDRLVPGAFRLLANLVQQA